MPLRGKVIIPPGASDELTYRGRTSLLLFHVAAILSAVARVRIRRLAKEHRAYERKVRAGVIVPQRDYLAEAKEAWLNGDTELALRLFAQLPSKEQTAYDWQIAQEQRRASKPSKHNRACRPNACLCDHSLMARYGSPRDVPGQNLRSIAPHRGHARPTSEISGFAGAG